MCVCLFEGGDTHSHMEECGNQTKTGKHPHSAREIFTELRRGLFNFADPRFLKLLSVYPLLQTNIFLVT